MITEVTTKVNDVFTGVDDYINSIDLVFDEFTTKYKDHETLSRRITNKIDKLRTNTNILEEKLNQKTNEDSMKYPTPDTNSSEDDFKRNITNDIDTTKRELDKVLREIKNLEQHSRKKLSP